MDIHIIYINNDYHTINSKKELQLSIIYSTDLTDKQWDIIKPLLPAPKKRGHPRVVDLRRIINGILYINRTGCQWRMLPKEFLPWQTTYGYFRQFRINGTWDLIHDTLREKVRVEAQREKTPSAAIIDSQSVKTTEKGGFADMMQQRRFLEENGTLLLTLWDFFWRSLFMQQIFKIEMVQN